MRRGARMGMTVRAGRLLGPMAARLAFLRPKFGSFAPGPRDVIVATYPKSGTNLVMQVSLQIAWRGAAEFEHIHDLVPWPDAPSRKVVRLDAEQPPSATGHRIIKTHLDATRTPWRGDGLSIAVIRDPKEVVVSAYYFAGGLLGLLDTITPDDWVELFLADAFPFGRWADHAAGWWDARDHDRVELINFRSIKRDLPGYVDRIAGWMGVDLEPAERAAVIERAGLDWMRAHESKFSPMPLPGVPSAGTKMIRSGKSGSSSELLSLEQQRAIDAHSLAGLEELGSDFPYRDWFDLS